MAGSTDLRTLSGRLDHADASTTLDIYAHFVRQADEKAVGTIGTVLERWIPGDDPPQSACA